MKCYSWTEKYGGSLKPGDRIYFKDTVVQIRFMNYNFSDDTVNYIAYEDVEYIKRMQKL